MLQHELHDIQYFCVEMTQIVEKSLRITLKYLPTHLDFLWGFVCKGLIQLE